MDPALVESWLNPIVRDGKPVALKGLMTMLSYENAISNTGTRSKMPMPMPIAPIDFLLTELYLIDSSHKLGIALRDDNNDFEAAIKALEEINELEFLNAFVLIVHNSVFHEIRMITEFIGEVTEWFELDEQEMVQHIMQTEKIRCLAKVIFDKCEALFNIPNGKSFLEVFNEGVDYFDTLTEDMDHGEIFNFTSTIFEILVAEGNPLDYASRLCPLLSIYNSDCEDALKVLNRTPRKINQMDETINNDGKLFNNCERIALKGFMTLQYLDNVISNTTTGYVKQIKRTSDEMLHTEQCLVEYSNKLRLALRNKDPDYEALLKLLDELNELEFMNVLMLMKHRDILGTLKQVSKYVVNRTQLENQQELWGMITIFKKIDKIQHKANAIFNKFAALFNVSDEKSFQKVFNKVTEDFKAATEGLNREQIWRLNLNLFEILLSKVCLLDCVQKLRLFLNSNHADCETVLNVLEVINELKCINVFMLIKHKEVVITIKQMSGCVENSNELNLNKQETIKHNEKMEQIRCKADAILNKFLALFNGSKQKKMYDELIKIADNTSSITHHPSQNNKTKRKIITEVQVGGKKIKNP